MKLQIVNDKKLDWNCVKKVMVKITSESLNYEEPLGIADLERIYFSVGKMLQDYHNNEK